MRQEQGERDRLIFAEDQRFLEEEKERKREAEHEMHEEIARLREDKKNRESELRRLQEAQLAHGQEERERKDKEERPRREKEQREQEQLERERRELERLEQEQRELELQEEAERERLARESRDAEENKERLRQRELMRAKMHALEGNTTTGIGDKAAVVDASTADAPVYEKRKIVVAVDDDIMSFGDYKPSFVASANKNSTASRKHEPLKKVNQSQKLSNGNSADQDDDELLFSKPASSSASRDPPKSGKILPRRLTQPTVAISTTDHFSDLEEDIEEVIL